MVTASVRVVVIACVVLAAPAHAMSLSCDRCTLPIAGTRFTVIGSITTDPLAVDIVGYAARARFGAVELHEVVITARDRGDAIRVCAAGSLAGTHVLACSTVPRSLARLDQLRAADITWRLSGAATGTGTAHVAWTDHAARVELELAGAARVAEYDAGPVHVRDVDVPLAFGVVAHDDRIDIVPHGAIVARARDTRIELGAHTLRVADATFIAHDARPFTPDTFAGDAHELAWTAIRGLPLDVGAGSAILRVVDGEVRVERVRATALGASVELAPFALHDELETVLHVRGLALAGLIRDASHGRVAGTGVLDGDLVVRHAADGFSIIRGELHARGGGELHLVDPVWRDKAASTVASLAIHRRVVTALADLAYDKLSVAVQPSGSDPDSIVRVHGHGTTIPQELELAIDIHGARDTARLLAAHLDP